MQIDSRSTRRGPPTPARSCARSRCSGRPTSSSRRASQHGPRLPDGGSIPTAQVAPDGPARPDPVDVRSGHTARVRGLAAAGRNRADQPGRGLQRRVRASCIRSRPTSIGAGGAEPRQRRHEHAAARRRPGVLGAEPSPAQLQGFIRNSNAVFAATAARGHGAGRTTIRAFPAFTGRDAADDRPRRPRSPRTPSRSSTSCDRRPCSSARRWRRPLIVRAGAPRSDDRHRPADTGSNAGVPAFEKFLDDSVPWLTRLTPYLGNLVPVIDYINDYRREIAAFFANSTATTQATCSISLDQGAALPADLQPRQSGGADHLPEAPGEQPAEPVHGPRRRYTQLLHGLSVFGSYLCTNNPQPTRSARDRR